MPEITDEEFEQFEQYKQIGSVEEVTSVVTDMNTMMRDNVIQSAATSLGYKPSVLAKLTDEFDIKIEDDKVYLVDGETEHELSEYAQSNWEDFMPSLSVKEEKQNGVPYVPQSAVHREAKSSGKKQAVNYIMQRYGWVLGNEPVK